MPTESNRIVRKTQNLCDFRTQSTAFEVAKQFKILEEIACARGHPVHSTDHLSFRLLSVSMKCNIVNQAAWADHLANWCEQLTDRRAN